VLGPHCRSEEFSRLRLVSGAEAMGWLGDSAETAQAEAMRIRIVRDRLIFVIPLNRKKDLGRLIRYFKLGCYRDLCQAPARILQNSNREFGSLS
jgi:hypothetical protein